jgi:hypothetical protein
MANHAVTSFYCFGQIRLTSWSLSAIAFAHADSLPSALWFWVRCFDTLGGVNSYPGPLYGAGAVGAHPAGGFVCQRFARNAP